MVAMSEAPASGEPEAAPDAETTVRVVVPRGGKPRAARAGAGTDGGSTIATSAIPPGSAGRT